eukprot:3624296-Pleurochrysis_carterae.AAC.2
MAMAAATVPARAGLLVPLEFRRGALGVALGVTLDLGSANNARPLGGRVQDCAGPAAPAQC